MTELWSPEWKQRKLTNLQEEWKECTRCSLHETRRKVVFGCGNPDADILFVGEAPGENEDKQGRPFVGKAGEMLNSMLAGLDRNRDELYITNVISCRPPNNRDPSAEERVACFPRLEEIIYLVDPLLIVPVGKYALNSLVGGRSWGIERYRGNLFSSPQSEAYVTGETNGVEIEGRFFPRNANKMKYRLEYDAIPILHPSYIQRMDNSDSDGFEPNGPAEQTFFDLDKIFTRVEQLKSEHERTKQLINRSA